MSFVLDNSVTMRWFFGDGQSADLAFAERVLEALQTDEAVVPVTWALEVANVIARAEATELVDEARSREFLELLEQVSIEPDPATFTQAVTSTLELARRYKLSAYDASYLELALRRGLPLATLDQDLRKAATKAGVRKFR